MLLVWFNILTSVAAVSIFPQANLQIGDLLQEDDPSILESDLNVITELMVLIYENKNYNFLDRYFGDVYFGDHKNLDKEFGNQDTSFWASKEITYPDKDDITDIVSGRSDRYVSNPLSGFLSFAHLPLTNCFTEDAKFDIGIVGATFDTGVSFRPGSRFGPQGIRMATKRMSSGSISPFRRNYNLFKKGKIVDCGDPPMTPIDNRVALDQLYRAERAILKSDPATSDLSKFSRILTLGGDHTITLSCLRAVYEKWGKVAVIHFDSHLDTIDPYQMNENVTEYAALNHGTFFHWAAKRGLISEDKNLHVGLRGYYENMNDTVRDSAIGFERIMSRDIDNIGISGIIKRIKDRVGHSKVYITVDIDSLDPSSAPGTGTVEPGGFSSRELLTILDGLEGLEVIGGDVVEVSPPYDSNEITTMVASEVARSLLGLMVITPIQ